jgi:hypothetical protein
MSKCSVHQSSSRSIHLISRLLLATAIAFCLGSGVLTSLAKAGTINVWACHQPNGQSAPLDRWSSNITAPFIDATNTCASGANGVFALYVFANSHPGHSYGTWQFTTPPNTTVTGFQYNRSWSVWGWASFQGFRGTQPIWDSSHLFELCQAAAGCHDAPWQVVATGFNNEAGVLLMLESCALAGGCDANSNGWAMVKSARVTLEDSESPTFSSLSGDIASDVPLDGNADLNFQVTDVGTGVYKIHATVDGVSFDDRVLDANDSKCQAVSGPRDFIYAVPCRLNLSASTSLDTTALTDGTHDIKVIVEDAAGNQTTVFNDDVTTQNAPPSEPDSATPDPSSSPTDATNGAGSAASGGTGGPDSSRARSRAKKPKIVLKITPRRTRNKRTIRFRGRIIGDQLPRRGVTLLAQARRKNGWIVFRQIGVNGRGQFGFNYRFHSTTAATIYTFRIALAHADRYSVRRAVSNPVKVRVKP